MRRHLMKCLIVAALLLAARDGVAQPQPRRRVSFNGRALALAEEALLAQLEQRFQLRLPDGAYWYDARTGAAGAWGGPTAGFLPAGLRLGGPMPADCSGGGTRVFINGRELHPRDVLALQQMIGFVMPGRYWLDATGTGGYEGGPPAFNLFALARAAQARGGGGDNPWTRSVGHGKDNVTMGYFGGGDMYISDGKGNSWWPGK
jgi:hypothetical protein